VLQYTRRPFFCGMYDNVARPKDLGLAVLAQGDLALEHVAHGGVVVVVEVDGGAGEDLADPGAERGALRAVDDVDQVKLAVRPDIERLRRDVTGRHET